MKDIKIIDDLDYRETDVSLEYLKDEKIDDNIDLEDTVDYTKIFGKENDNEN